MAGHASASGWQGTAFASFSPAARLRRAALFTVESLEARRLLSAALSETQIQSIWLHVKPAEIVDLHTLTQANPRFAARLDADLAFHHLPTLGAMFAAISAPPIVSSQAAIATASSPRLHHHRLTSPNPVDHHSRGLHRRGTSLTRAGSVAVSHHPALRPHRPHRRAVQCCKIACNWSL